MNNKRRFARVAAAGITFQAGSAAIDSATIMSTLVFQLTGNPIIIGAVTAILRFGWLFPQFIVGFLAQRSGSSLRYYVIGAFGRASCMAALALVLYVGAGWSSLTLSIFVMAIWTAYAFMSGIVGVPYNDLVARAVPSELRSRLLAVRFFGGGVLALGVVAIADRLVGALVFPLSYAAIIAPASVLMFLSSGIFTSIGEPATTSESPLKPTFFQYLRDGGEVFQTDLRFRRFVYVSQETVRFWWNRIGPLFASEIRKRRAQNLRCHSNWQWHLDEVFVKINGETHYLWWAVDHEGEVLESYVTKRRDRKAALKFLRKTMKRFGPPHVIVTDLLRSYGAAMKVIGNSDSQETGRWLNNRAANSHLPFRRLEEPCTSSDKHEHCGSLFPSTRQF